MPKTTGPKFVADTLKAYGVNHVFFVPQMLLDTLTGMEGMGIRRVLTHGEKAAAYMADGYARASGKPGVCMAQHVGASNLAAGLRDAYLACSPVIALTGGPAAAAIGSCRRAARRPCSARTERSSRTTMPRPRSGS